MILLRQYQIDAIEAVRERDRDSDPTRRKCIVNIPTGTGKTVLAMHMVARAVANGHRVAWIAHRDELIGQARDTFAALAPEHALKTGLVKAGSDECDAQLVFASLQTLWQERRRDRLFAVRPEFALVIADEAHHYSSAESVKVMQAIPADAAVVGLTATVERGDGGNLGAVFPGGIAFSLPLLVAIRDGYLVPFVPCPVQIDDLDLDAIGTVAGDFNQGQLGEAMEEEHVVAATASAIAEHARERRSVVFTVTVAQAEKTCVALTELGIVARTVHAETPTDERKAVLRDFRAGTVQAVCNCAILCLDDKTEILTSAGWTGVDEMSLDHEVGNVDMDSGNVTFEKPLDVVRRDRLPDERMVSVEHRRRSIRVTESHRLLYRTRDCARPIKPFSKAPARDVVDFGRVELPVSSVALAGSMSTPQEARDIDEKSMRSKISRQSYHLRTREGYGFDESKIEAERRIRRRYALRRKDPNELTLDECRLIGFWIGDGTKVSRYGCGTEYNLCQDAHTPVMVDIVDRIINAADVDFVKRLAKDGHSYRWGLPRGTGGGSQKRAGVYSIEPYLDKSISPLMWGLDEAQFDAFIDGYWLADGNHGKEGAGHKGRENGTGKRISSAHLQRLERVQALACCRGYATSLHTRLVKGWALHSLGFWKAQSASTELTIETDWKPERVWCVRTRTKNIITRRHGTVTIMGNTEGWDEPSANCIVLARPTKSKTLYLQMMGRALRLYPGKRDALIIDLMGATARHSVIQAAALIDEMEREAASARLHSRGCTPPCSATGCRCWCHKLHDGAQRMLRADWTPPDWAHWVDLGDGASAASTPGLTVVVWRDGPEDEPNVWRCTAWRKNKGRLDMTPSPVWIDLARGIGEDLLRRAGGAKIAKKDAAWRERPATEGQIAALRRFGVDIDFTASRGEAGDKITAAIAGAQYRKLRSRRDRSVPLAFADAAALDAIVAADEWKPKDDGIAPF